MPLREPIERSLTGRRPLRAYPARLRRRPPRRRLARRLRVATAISLLLHLLALVLLLVTIPVHEREEFAPPASPVTMVFEKGNRNGPSAPEPTPEITPQFAPPKSVVPAQEQLPVPPEPPPPPPEPQPATPPQPAPPEPAAPQPVPSEPAPQQPGPPTPPPEQAEPVPIPPPAPPRPLPPPPKPPPPKPSLARPATPAHPPAHRSDFPAPMNFSFGSPRLTPQSKSSARTDFSYGPVRKGTENLSPFSELDDANAGPDWRNALSRWVQQHAYYPSQARANGEEGDAKVHVEATADGKVTSVELIGRSGSMWLDLALQALFRDQHIPGIPGRTEPIVFNFTMHYILIRR